MTNQQGAPEALRHAKYLTVVYRDINPGDEARELIMHPKITAASWSHAMNERDRLAALVEAQQPAPSAAPTQDMIAAVLQLVDLEQGDVEDPRYDDGSKLAEQICKAVVALVPQPSPTPQADSQPALPKITAEDRSFLHYNPNTDDIVEWVQHYASAAITADRAIRAQAAPVAQGDALPREDFAWMVVQEACETEPADEDDPECIRILRRDLKSAVLAAFLREDNARAQAKEGANHG